MYFKYVNKKTKINKFHLWCHIFKCLLGRRRHCLLNDNDGSRDILLLHSLTVNFDRFDGYFWVLGKEDKHLIGWIVRVRHQDGQILA